MHGTAYLPQGDCFTIKRAYDAMLADQLSRPASEGRLMTFDYKGAKFSASSRWLVAQAQLRTTCEADGSLRVSAKR